MSLQRAAVARPAGHEVTTAPLSRRQLAAVALGQAFEFYDFSVYGFFAVPIGRAFFPASNPWTSLLLALAGYGVGYGARPLGALFFGVYADRRGRKPALLLSVILMALGTLGMALVPSYATLGPVAPVLMVGARLVQGFALGGEIGPSTTYLFEAAPRRLRGFTLSWQFALNGAAVLAAGLIGGGLAMALPSTALDVWGWRLAFLVGLGIVPAGLAIRAYLPTPPSDPDVTDRGVVWPVIQQPACFIAAIMIIGTGTVPFSIATFMTSYARAALHLNSTVAFLAAVAVGMATLCTAPLAGRVSDRFGARWVLLASRLAMAVVAWPLFAWLEQARDGSALLAVSAILATIATLGSPAGLQLVAESMPTQSRATGVALAYTLGISLFGGVTQLAAAALIDRTGSPVSPAYLLIAAGLVGAASVRPLKTTTKRV